MCGMKQLVRLCATAFIGCAGLAFVFANDGPSTKSLTVIPPDQSVDDVSQKEFLNGAKIAYETIITDFSDNDNKITTSKPLLNKEIYDQFSEALKKRSDRGHYAEITFIGINLSLIHI